MPSPSLKPLSEQVVVITGASSGIGRLTAISAAKAGAKVVVTARSEGLLQQLVAEIVAGGGEAIAVTCDVSERAQVDGVVSAALAKFGRIDTFVNNAGVAMFGRLDETDTADAKRLFDVNFFGLVNGCLAALPALKQNANGGALICLGSQASDDMPPLQGMYAASKHAIKGTHTARYTSRWARGSGGVTAANHRSLAACLPYPCLRAV
jgi:NADP-dependent 3-hydroxy acid dehydrogenase YdfG